MESVILLSFTSTLLLCPKVCLIGSAFHHYSSRKDGVKAAWKYSGGGFLSRDYEGRLACSLKRVKIRIFSCTRQLIPYKSSTDRALLTEWYKVEKNTIVCLCLWLEWAVGKLFISSGFYLILELSLIGSRPHSPASLLFPARGKPRGQLIAKGAKATDSRWKRGGEREKG